MPAVILLTGDTVGCGDCPLLVLLGEEISVSDGGVTDRSVDCDVTNVGEPVTGGVPTLVVVAPLMLFKPPSGGVTDLEWVETATTFGTLGVEVLLNTLFSKLCLFGSGACVSSTCSLSLTRLSVSLPASFDR